HRRPPPGEGRRVVVAAKVPEAASLERRDQLEMAAVAEAALDQRRVAGDALGEDLRAAPARSGLRAAPEGRQPAAGERHRLEVAGGAEVALDERYGRDRAQLLAEDGGEAPGGRGRALVARVVADPRRAGARG